MWKFGVPVENWCKAWALIALRYFCWAHPKFETMSHLFLISNTSAKLGRMSGNVVGIHIEGLKLLQVVIKWWASDCCPILKPHIIVVPTFMIWNLWKRRNSLKHGSHHPTTILFT